MTDSLFQEDDAPDYQQLANRLLEQGEEQSPAAVQGCLCGALVAGAAGEPAMAPVVLESALEMSVYGELAETTMSLYTNLLSSLADEELSFYPLLPDDDEGIEERTSELAAWCRGFLAGYTFAASTASEDGASATNPDDEEILSDISAIADAEVDTDAEEQESESSYMELVEYLRMAIFNMCAHRQWDAPVE